MPALMKDTCSTCRHFHAPSGRCQRYPQAVSVAVDYKCGEHSPAMIGPTIRVPTVLPKPLTGLPALPMAPATPLVSVPAAVAPSAQPVKRGKRQPTP